MSQRKRSHGEYEADSDKEGGWQQAESKGSKRRKKAAKKIDSSYPSITHSAHARLQSYVKLSDLQNLALYLIADGTAPQWVSVRHHSSVRKVVVLMVPALEADMFDGNIALPSKSQSTVGELPDAEGSTAQASNGDSSKLAEQIGNAPKDDPSSFAQSRTSRNSPDQYYPTKLVSDRLPQPLQALSSIFDHIWPIRTPGDDKFAKMHSPLAAMMTAPLVKSKEDKKSKGPQFPREGKNWQNNRTPIPELLATTNELTEEGYVLHAADGWVDMPAKLLPPQASMSGSAITSGGSADTTAPAPETTTASPIPSLVTTSAGSINSTAALAPERVNDPVTAGRNVLAMDCEMCITSPKGVAPQIFSLTRISIIDWDGKTVMDELVKPANPITDYLTPYSGITPALLAGVTTTLADIQQKLAGLLTPQTVLIGHSLNSDLNALQITFPFIIDTALLYPHPRGPPLKSSLKWLAQKYLMREIQKGHGSTGHDSIEDARACLDLVKQKCEKGKAWGTSEASGESIFKRIGRSTRPKRDKVNPVGDDEPRVGAVVDWGEPSRGYGSQAKVAIGCESDAEVVAGVKRAVEGDADDAVVPKGGCDLIWARLRELEAHRGWWSRSKLVDSDALRSSTQASTAEASLADVVAETSKRIAEIYEALPPCTAFIVYSGSGNPRELSEMQAVQQKFKEEYKTKKWDELTVRWTDVEEQKLRRACEKARKGVGFVTVK